MTLLRVRFSTQMEEVDIVTPHRLIQDEQGILIYPGSEKTDFIYCPWHLFTSPLRVTAIKENP